MKVSLSLKVLALWALLASSGCGPTVGDSCTTPADCNDALCLRLAYTPGGYCSRQCVPSAEQNDCPRGSLCVPNGGGEGLDACFLACSRDADCRAGYLCRNVSGVTSPVCVGPQGF
jgi:hypothetical protein